MLFTLYEKQSPAFKNWRAGEQNRDPPGVLRVDLYYRVGADNGRTMHARIREDVVCSLLTDADERMGEGADGDWLE
jgi:hypothetical protein